jgi:hypothetical protein
MSQDEYDQAPASLAVRELRVGAKILVTTLLDPKQVSKDELKRLYASRWNIELDLRNIKTKMGMERLSCLTPEMAVKEIWVYLLAYNLIRLMMAQSAQWLDLVPRALRFKHSVQLCVTWNSHPRLNDTTTEQMQALFILIAQQRVGDRLGGSNPGPSNEGRNLTHDSCKHVNVLAPTSESMDIRKSKSKCHSGQTPNASSDADYHLAPISGGLCTARWGHQHDRKC